MNNSWRDSISTSSFRFGELEVDRIEDRKVFVMELSSSSGSSKRPKSLSNTAQIVSCLVDGCNSDLSQCREYHRRHKVCEHHSKSPKVTIGGREQRFCQQCSRFHSLTEFDEGKRSCRKRLDGHNRRRRKPQSDSLSRAPGMFLSSQQGTRFLSFNTPEILPSAVVSSAWGGAVKADSDQGCRFEPFPVSPPNSYKGVNHFQFMQDTDQSILPASGDSGNRMFSDRLTHRAGNPDRAFSLLSSSVPARTRDVGPSHVVHPGSTSLSQSLLHNLHFSGLGQYTSTQEMESKPSVPDVDSNERNNTTLHFRGMFQNEPDCSTASRAPQTRAFWWE